MWAILNNPNSLVLKFANIKKKSQPYQMEPNHEPEKKTYTYLRIYINTKKNDGIHYLGLKYSLHLYQLQIL